VVESLLGMQEALDSKKFSVPSKKKKIVFLESNQKLLGLP
jgi:hypothetical protein